MENITIRKKLTRSQSDVNLSKISSNSDILNSTMLMDCTVLSTQSETHNSQAEHCSLTEYKQEINSLKSKLNSADREIDNMLGEINNLKIIIDKQERQIELLKGVVNITPQQKKSISKRIMNINSPRSSPLYAKISCPTNKKSPLHNESNLVNNTIYLDTVAKTTQQSEIIDSHNIQNKDINIEKIPQAELISQKRKVLILGDAQARELCRLLKKLLGPEYAVSSYLKPGATLKDITSTTENYLVRNLSSKDYIIILGGCDDKNPNDLQFNLNLWLSQVTNTNIIISEVPYNKHLNESKLNYAIKFVCNRFSNAVYMDMNYSKFIPKRHGYKINLARCILKEILHLDYMHKKQEYNLLIKTHSLVDKSVQTTLSIDSHSDLVNNSINNGNKCRIDAQISGNSEKSSIVNNLFRV